MMIFVYSPSTNKLNLFLDMRYILNINLWISQSSEWALLGKVKVCGFACLHLHPFWAIVKNITDWVIYE